MNNEKKPRQKRNMVIMLVCVGTVFGGLYAFQQYKSLVAGKIIAQMQDKTEVISTYTASKQLWTDRITAIGTLVAIKGADLEPQVAGNVMLINFSSGEDVKQGTLLIKQDTTQQVAQLISLQAQEVFARQTLDRDLKQYKVNAVSKQQIDSDWSNLNNLQGQVQDQLALIAKMNIRAPFKGRLGIRLVSVGQYLDVGTSYVSLQQLDDLFVDFYVPQRFLGTVRPEQAVEISVDTFPGEVVKGKVIAINSQVDINNGNALVRGRFLNPDKKLLPGMFADVSIVVSAPKEQVTLPQTAISYNSYGVTVYVLTKTGKKDKGKDVYLTEERFVETGTKRGDQIVVIKGVKDKELVVSAGQIKLRNGSAVTIDNSVLPTNDPDPKPVEK
ncbi:efflux RND transporter periplasmic adaptor subunit [Pseudovibrio sp. Tun.PSC04-5.I4]|uniref:efflux RND transporter periplasmic adaptor subunit n=1 Tax=Pseudovibrio sp. Tun.PSC04-5.I4 TaxID=1798213 RepID=UPI00088212A6|nr:efflux RND transporter periplasmic adaptor subunit [Pseudovibrio sp. Tun.PSC04-5.I4]SDQ71597.1 membrane fusion protein, multidrug efflux system [Pseudovibrio sp. Tun.PSC04-5.I4]